MQVQVTGKKLNQEWNVNASHALYSKHGRWYHVLERFPGALFDKHGYVLFPDVEVFRACSHLAIGAEVNVKSPDGISAIPGYIRIK